MSVSSIPSVTPLSVSRELTTALVPGVTGAHVSGQSTPFSPATSTARDPWLVRALPVAVSLAVALPLAVASGSAVSWVCAAAWGVALFVRAMSTRRPHDLQGALRRELRAAWSLSLVLSAGAVAGAVPMLDARWGLVVIVTAAAGSVGAQVVPRRRQGVRRIVLVGSQDRVAAYSSSLSDASRVVVAGCYFADGPTMLWPAGSDGPTAGGLETLPELVSRVDADLVLVVPGPDTVADDIRRLSWALEGSSVSIGVPTPVTAVGHHRVATTELQDRTVLELAPVGASALQSCMKSALDRLCAAALLFLLSPLLLLLVLGVRLDSEGPGLFVQTRVGRNGETFRMLKLRTMYSDADAMKQALLANNEADGVLFKIRRDPRVTRLGYWLRRSSLDELPQLLNVLRGEMSLIGPRPALPSEVAAYDDDAHRRHAVKPGITGLWQVSGRSDLLWDDALRLDLFYADNWRLVDDLTIAARTISAVATGRGAY